MWPFKPNKPNKPKKLGSVYIMNAGYMYWDEIPEEKKNTINKISEIMDYYTDRMVAHMHSNTPIYGTLSLCEMSANYDMDNETVNIFAKGKKVFSWSGKVEDLLNQKMINPLLELAPPSGTHNAKDEVKGGE